jgi:hypothetical protein
VQEMQVKGQGTEHESTSWKGIMQKVQQQVSKSCEEEINFFFSKHFYTSSF